MRVIIGVDGHEVEQREQLPSGGDTVVSAEVAPLTEDEDAGLRSALDAAEAGLVKPAEEVRRHLEEMVARRRLVIAPQRS